MCFNPISYLIGKKAGGGGGSHHDPIIPKAVNFIDYDGTILYSYTAQEYSALSALPSNPSHTGLVAQGWNWTKSQIDAYLLANPGAVIWVGQMYITQSGDTEIDIEIKGTERLAIALSLSIDGNILINWGDLSVDDATGSDLEYIQEFSHLYNTSGNYTIKIHVVNGEFSFNNDGLPIIHKYNNDPSENHIYASYVKNLRIGDGISYIGSGSFSSCVNLLTLTIPNSITDIQVEAFSDCIGLSSVVIPTSVTDIEEYVFNGCCNLSQVSLPNNIDAIGPSVFYSCSNLSSITIPSNLELIEEGLFGYCFNLSSIIIPNSVTAIGDYAFENCIKLCNIAIPSGVKTIGKAVFSSCYCLETITVPNSVTNIEDEAFTDCSGILNYHFQSETPPTLGIQVFHNITSDGRIYVPSSSIDAYKQAQNWSSYDLYIYGE